MQRSNTDDWSPVSRRQALLGIGTVATGGAGVSALLSESAAAQVSVDSFDVADATFTTDQADPRLGVTLAYDFDAGNDPVAELLFEVRVGGDVIVTDTLSTSVTTHAGTVDLAGSITDSGAWSPDDFAPAVAASVTREVSVGIHFAVLTSSGGVIVETSASDTATVTISHPQESRLVATVGGSGTITNGE